MFWHNYTVQEDNDLSIPSIILGEEYTIVVGMILSYFSA